MNRTKKVLDIICIVLSGVFGVFFLLRLFWMKNLMVWPSDFNPVADGYEGAFWILTGFIIFFFILVYFVYMFVIACTVVYSIALMFMGIVETTKHKIPRIYNAFLIVFVVIVICKYLILSLDNKFGTGVYDIITYAVDGTVCAFYLIRLIYVISKFKTFYPKKKTEKKPDTKS